MRLPETWPASCESRTNEVLDQVVSSVAETTKKRYISQKMQRLPHFSAHGRATKAPGEIKRPDQVVRGPMIYIAMVNIYGKAKRHVAI